MRRFALVLTLLVLALPLGAQPAPLHIDSKVLGEKRTALVSVPRSYRTGAQSYPVVYMTDGDAQLGHTAATAEYLAREGRMPEVILVGIANTDRARDLTPTRVERQTFDGQPFGFPTSGGADKFLAFIETELIPAVEKQYRTQPYRVFAGHSFGGLFALHALATKPRLFSAWIAVSPSVMWDDNVTLRKLQATLKSTPELNATLVYSIGDEPGTMTEGFEALKQLFASGTPRGFESHHLSYPDEDHGSVVMPTHYAGLRKIFDPWRFTIARNDDPLTLLIRATEHYARISKRVGFAVPIPEALVNRIGYMLLGRDHTTEAIEAFRRNAQLHPKSANVYDSLAEALEKKGDLAEAKTNYEKAWTIGKEIADPNTEIYKRNLERVSKPQPAR